MKRTILKFIGIYIAFLLQSLIFENLMIFTVVPDVLLMAVILCALSSDINEATVLGAGAGFLKDCMVGRLFGGNILSYMILSVLVSALFKKGIDNSPLLCACAAFISAFIYRIVTSLVLMTLGMGISFLHALRESFIEGICCFVPVLLLVLLKITLEKKKALREGESA